DDRDERPGVKFKDADLLGLPIRVVVGERSLAQDCVEIKLRTEKKPTMVPVREAGTQIIDLAGT
ncbi:MAG: proline--tRNA ligase, partial [Lentisphaerae bacterium]|nr:proline--tRNA ligase [Lentisphaerota bacterium]